MNIWVFLFVIVPLALLLNYFFSLYVDAQIKKVRDEKEAERQKLIADIRESVRLELEAKCTSAQK